MRSTYLWIGLLAACGGNDVDPRTIPGGGIGDGEIDGEVNVTIIDRDDNPIVNATVQVGDVEKETDEDGVAVFSDVSGRQDVVVVADGFRQVAWLGVDGANVTIPLVEIGTTDIPQATLSGTIPGFADITVDANHIKAGLVLYSQSDRIGDDENSLPQTGEQICGVLEAECTWSIVARTGTITLIAAIVDRDTKGTLAEDDDTSEFIGWATRTVTVEDGVNQSGLELELVEAGNLEDVTIDLGSPPASLTETFAVVGISIGEGEVVQIPILPSFPEDTLLAPVPSVFGADASYRLTAIAQTSSGDDGAQSILIERGLEGPDLVAGEWLVPPTSVAVTETDASWEPTEGATVHTVAYQNALGENIAEITVFDGSTEVQVPALFDVSDAVTARVSAIGSNLDLNDFSLDEDADLLFGIAAEPTDL